MYGLLRLAVVLMVAAATRGEPYWIAYEANTVPTGNTGNCFPEDEGWVHAWYGTPDRWLEDGTLVIDSLGSTSWVEYYWIDMDGALDPGPGEVFVAQWRLCVDEATNEDLCVGVWSNESWSVGLVMDEDSVRSIDQPGLSAGFEPGVFHAFELRSSDMRSYRLFVDGQLAFQGLFVDVISQSEVSWGEGSQSAASLSRWDYFRFGVVPETDDSSFVSGVARVPPPSGPDGSDVDRDPDGSSADDAPAQPPGAGGRGLDWHPFGGAPEGMLEQAQIDDQR